MRIANHIIVLGILTLLFCSLEINAKDNLEDILDDPYLKAPKKRNPSGKGKIVENENLGGDENMANMLNMAMGMVQNVAGATGMLDGVDGSKDKNSLKPSEGGKEGAGAGEMDMSGMLNMASGLMSGMAKDAGAGGDNNGSGLDMAGMLKMASGVMQQMNSNDPNKKGEVDMASMLNMASTMLGGNGKGNDGNNNQMAMMASMAGNLLNSMSASGDGEGGAEGASGKSGNGNGGIMESMSNMLGGKAATAGTGMLLASQMLPKLASVFGGSTGGGYEEIAKFLFTQMEDHVDPQTYARVKKNMAKMPNDMAEILSEFNLKQAYDGYMLLQTKNVQKKVLEVEILYLVSILLEYILIPGLLCYLCLFLFRYCRKGRYDRYNLDKKHDGRDHYHP